MKSNKKWSMLTLIMMFWFTISFITNILAAYQQELVEAKTLYEQCLELILRFAFHLSASGWPPGVVESLAAGK